MTPQEFVSGGLLADLCRHWAHPLGLDVVVSSPTSRRVTLEIVDEYLQAPGGVVGVSAEHPMAATKLRRVATMRARRRAYRIRMIGAYYEPVQGYSDEAIPLTRARDVEGQPAFVEAVGVLAGRLAADAVHSLTASIPDCPDVLSAWFAEVITAKVGVAVAHVLARLRVTYEGAFFLAQAPEDTSLDEKAAGLRARVQYLAAEIPHLQQECGSLFDKEEDEAKEIIERLSLLMARKHDDELVEDDEVAQALKRLEYLHGLAQPGMRFFRPEAEEYHVGIEHLRAWAKKTISQIRQTRTDIDNLMAGDISPDEIGDKGAVVTFLREQIEMRESALAQLQEAVAEETAAIKSLAASVEAIEASA